MSAIRDELQALRDAWRVRRRSVIFAGCLIVVIAVAASIHDFLNHDYLGAALTLLIFLIVIPWAVLPREKTRRVTSPLKSCSIQDLQHLKHEADYLASAVDTTHGELKPEDVERLKRFKETLDDINRRNE